MPGYKVSYTKTNRFSIREPRGMNSITFKPDGPDEVVVVFLPLQTGLLPASAQRVTGWNEVVARTRQFFIKTHLSVAPDDLLAGAKFVCSMWAVC